MIKYPISFSRLPILLAITLLLASHTGFSQSKQFSTKIDVIKKLLLSDKIDSANQVFKEISTEIDLSKETIETALFYQLKAAAALKQDKFEEEQEYLLLFLKTAKKLRDHNLIASALLGFASHFENIGDLKNATPYFLSALDEYSLTNKIQQIAYLYNKIGLVYYADNNFEKARTYFISAYLIYKKHEKEDIEYAYWVQNCLSNIALTYLQTNDLNKALAYSKMALGYCQTANIDKVRPIAVIKSNIGSIYGKMGKYNLAEKYFREGIEVCLKPENHETYHAIQSIISLAKLLTIQGKFVEAETELSRAAKLINGNVAYMGALDKYYRQLAYLKFAEKDYKAAFEAQNEYIILDDSSDKILESRDYNKEILIHDLENQKTQNELLRSENNYKGLANKIIIIIIVFMILLAVLILIGQVKSKDKNKKLEEYNQRINEQKNSLEKLNQDLVKINQNKSFLIQSVAHDLRTPIGNVMNLNEFLSESDLKEQDASGYIKLIRSSCLLALNIMEDILDQSMIEKGKLQLNLKHGNIKQLIQESIHLLHFRAKPKNITIDFESSLDIELKIDHERIKRVLMNILMNAIKFTPRGCNIFINQWIEGDHCIISIKDEGIGMSEEIIAQIFERDTPAARLGLEMERSIGIGLAITKSIVESHGGEIKVESKPNSGSTFYIELPLSKI